MKMGSRNNAGSKGSNGGGSRMKWLQIQILAMATVVLRNGVHNINTVTNISNRRCYLKYLGWPQDYNIEMFQLIIKLEVK